MSFQEQLKRARKAKGYTQKQVADMMGITNSTYCGYETGKRAPSMDKVAKLSELLDVPVSTLLEMNTQTIAGKIAESQGNASTTTSDILMHSTSTNDILAAFLGGDDDFTQEELEDIFEDVRAYAQFVRARKLKEKSPPPDESKDG